MVGINISTLLSSEILYIHTTMHCQGFSASYVAVLVGLAAGVYLTDLWSV
jgi:hypothetical protein